MEKKNDFSYSTPSYWESQIAKKFLDVGLDLYTLNEVPKVFLSM